MFDDILSMFLSYLFGSWGYFRGVAHGLRNILYFFFTWVIEILFSSKTDIYIGFVSLFIDKSCNSKNQDFSWIYGGKIMTISRAQEGFCRQYKYGKFCPKIIAWKNTKWTNKYGIFRTFDWTMCPQEMPHAPRGMALPDDNVLAGPCAPACTITDGSG